MQILTGSKIDIIKISSEFKCSLSLVLPLIASEVVYALSGFIATVMISHLGKEQLAANALVWSIYMTISLFFINIFCASSVMVSQSFGAKDYAGSSIFFKQGLILAVILSIPMILIIWNIPIVLIWLKQDPNVIKHATAFFHALMWAVLPLNIIIVVQQFLIGINKPRLVMLMSIITVPIEIFFYYTLLFGKFGFPQIGLAGIGYSLAVSYSVIAIFCVYYCYFAKQMKQFNLFKQWWVIERKFFLEIFHIGLPMGTMKCSEVAFFATIAIMMGLLGTTALAAYQIAYQYLMLALVILFALHQNVSVRVGNEVGKNNLGQLNLAVIVNISIGLLFISIFSLFYFFFPRLAISLDVDVNDVHFKSVAIEAVGFFPIISLLLIIDCIRLISGGALRGLKDTKLQMFISILGFWGIAFPSSYLLAFKFCLGSKGILWGIVIGLFVTGVMYLLRFKQLVNNLDLKQ